MESPTQTKLIKVTVIIPVYNEIANIGAVLAEIKALAPVSDYGLEVLVVDGGSTDGTAEAALTGGARVVRQRGRGYGAACFTGFEEAANSDLLVFLDGDYSDPPSAIPLILKKLVDDEADLVLGSRTLHGLTRGTLPVQAVWGNRLVCSLIRLLYGYRLTDLPSLKAIRREQLASFDMHELTYGWTTEMLVKAVRSRYRIAEVGVTYRKRGGGQSKVSGTFKGTIKAGYFLLKTALRYRHWNPPLLVSNEKNRTEIKGL